MFNSIKRRVVDLTVMHMVVRGPENIFCPEPGFFKTKWSVQTRNFFLFLFMRKVQNNQF